MDTLAYSLGTTMLASATYIFNAGADRTSFILRPNVARDRARLLRGKKKGRFPHWAGNERARPTGAPATTSGGSNSNDPYFFFVAIHWAASGP